MTRKEFKTEKINLEEGEEAHEGLAKLLSAGYKIELQFGKRNQELLLVKGVAVVEDDN